MSPRQRLSQSFRAYHDAPKGVHLGTALLTAVGLGLVAWVLFLSKETGIGWHGVAVVGGVLVFVLLIAYPSRIALLGNLISRTKLGRSDKPEAPE